LAAGQDRRAGGDRRLFALPWSLATATQGPSRVSEASIDYVALEAEIEKVIVTGPATLDNVRAVLVSVDGETKIAHYRRRRPRARVLGDQERGQHPDRGRHR
jgi:hypothetical protein